MHAREPCPICNGYDAAVLDTHDRRGAVAVALLCRGCGLIRTEDAVVRERPFRAPGRRRLWRSGRAAKATADLLRSVVPQGAFGCDSDADCGVLMYVLKRAGYGMSGAAGSTDAVLYARQALGSAPEAQTWSKLRCSDGSFDFIVLSRLDREPDPTGALLKAFTKLRSDGILCLDVPDAEVLLRARRPGRRFSMERMFYFSGLTLRALAYKSGFLPVSEGSAGTHVLFRKTHAPVPTRAVPLPDHADFLLQCAHGHAGARWRNRMQRLRLQRSAVRAGVQGFLSGLSPADMIIRG